MGRLFYVRLQVGTRDLSFTWTLTHTRVCVYPCVCVRVCMCMVCWVCPDHLISTSQYCDIVVMIIIIEVFNGRLLKLVGQFGHYKGKSISFVCLSLFIVT